MRRPNRSRATRATVLGVGLGLGLAVGACSTSYGEAPTSPKDDTDASGLTGTTDGGGETSTSDGDGGGGPIGCVNRTGVYEYGSKRTSGTCSEVNAAFATESCDQAFCVAYRTVYTAGTSKLVQDTTPACTGSVITAEDNCTTEFNYKCTTPSGVFQHVGRTTWSPDGLKGTGTSQITTYDQNDVVICTAGYAVTITK